jgi:hypothetical protein
MNWTRAFQDITTSDASFDRSALAAALAHDTVYMPSELAARLLPIDARRPNDTTTWDRSVQGADLQSRAR